MKLQEIVVESAVLTDLEATERDEAIREIVAAMVDAGAISQKKADEYIESIIRREERGSTGFGHGVAVPHVKHPEIKEMAVAIAVSRKGVEFNALDGNSVYSIFLLLSPEDRPEEHLDAMEAIFSNLQQERFRSFLRQATSVDDVMTLVKEADAETAAR